MTARARALLASLGALLLGLLAGAANAQSVVFSNSDPVVTIRSSFTGQAITLFGNIEPGPQGASPGPFEVVILVRGPAIDRVVRVRERVAGLVLTTGQRRYQDLPGYYAVLSSRPTEALLDGDALSDPLLSLAGVAGAARREGQGAAFDGELVRLLAEEGLFVDDGRGVAMLSPTTFSARIQLPSSVPDGLFVARALVVDRGAIVASRTTSFVVETQGIERLLSLGAQSNPALYGAFCVLLALGTGWLGGALFRR